jgi:hypothetical protein
LATIDAQSLDSCGSARRRPLVAQDCAGSIPNVCCPSAAQTLFAEPTALRR